MINFLIFISAAIVVLVTFIPLYVCRMKDQRIRAWAMTLACAIYGGGTLLILEFMLPLIR